jgi:hypothetical protein
MQQVIKGNRCGHDKNKIKVPALFGKTKSGARLPHSISECGRRLQYLASRIRGGISRGDIEREKDKPTGMLPWFVSLYDDPRFIGFLYNLNQGEPSRKRRSEGLESIVFLALGTIISRLNLYQMAYGFFNQRNEFIYFDYARIAKESGMSLVRVKRAMKVLQAAGFFNVISIVKTLDDGKKITIATQIHATDTVFDFLGLMPEFLADRETQVIKFHEKQSRLDKNRQKKEAFRKPFFSPSNRKPKQEVGLQSLVTKLTKPVPKVVKGRGYEIKQRMDQLKYQGYQPPEIIEILKREFPPPS